MLRPLWGRVPIQVVPVVFVRVRTLPSPRAVVNVQASMIPRFEMMLHCVLSMRMHFISRCCCPGPCEFASITAACPLRIAVGCFPRLVGFARLKSLSLIPRFALLPGWRIELLVGTHVHVRQIPCRVHRLHNRVKPHVWRLYLRFGYVAKVRIGMSWKGRPKGYRAE